MAEPDYGKLTSMHFYGWKRGLKTGMYYLRTRPAADAIKFTVDNSDPIMSNDIIPASCSLDNNDCVSCSG